MLKKQGKVSTNNGIQAVFPICAKKGKIFSVIFAQTLHKCKTTFKSCVFVFEKHEMTLNSGVFCFFLWKRDVWHGMITFFLFVNNPHNSESSKFAVRQPFFKDHHASRRKYLVCNAMTFFFLRSPVFLQVGIVKKRHHKA